MQILIVANGIMEDKMNVIHWAAQSEIVIAADGGADHCLSAGIVPDVVIGDLDSITPSLLSKLQKENKKIISFPVEKDFTDLELALKHAVDRGGDEIVVLGALGARWDMTVANLMLLGADFLSSRTVRLISSHTETVILRGGEKVMLQGRSGDLVSLIPLGNNASGVTTEGLQYPLDNATLTFAATRGVSNRMCSNQATVKLESGFLFCIHQRKKP